MMENHVLTRINMTAKQATVLRLSPLINCWRSLALFFAISMPRLAKRSLGLMEFIARDNLIAILWTNSLCCPSEAVPVLWVGECIETRFPALRSATEGA